MSHLITHRKSGSRRVQSDLDPVTMTEQHHVGETNINSIMRKYRKTGELPTPPSGNVYGDFVNAQDFHNTQNRLIEANDQFMEMPSDLRTRFDNDAGKFFGFVNDPQNLEECRKIGLIGPEPKVPDKPAKPDRAEPKAAAAPSDVAVGT